MNYLKEDVEILFQSVDEGSILQFCKEYAMNNIDFAEMLIKGLLFPHGETEEERLMSLPGEVDACFSNNVHFEETNIRACK